jgi:predicted porin
MHMNRKILVGLIAALVTTGALAQTNVTMYGVIDTTVRYTTNQVNANGTVGSQTALTEGAFQGPRIGFKGEEDLGGGTAAVFKLENGFYSNNGAFDQQGQLFGRQEFVGLKDKSWGELDAGRQYGLAFDLLGNYDPLGVGNFNENEWEAFIYGLRFDNTLKYSNTWGPVTAEVQYSIGGQAGQTSIGVTTGFSLAYTQGPFSIGGVYQQSTDANSAEATIAGVGGSFVAGPATLYLQYFDAKRDAGFAKAASNSGGPLANTSMMGNSGNTRQRKDGMWTAGVLFQATPAMGYTVGYMYDSVKNESSLGDNGRISTIYAIADYNLSKRTDIYFDIDRTTLGGGEIGDANTIMGFVGAPLGGNTSRTGAALGLRVKF